jgi:hypothetical protein
MPRFRKKPVVIEAVQYDGTAKSRDEIYLWTDLDDVPADGGVDGRPIVISTLEGDMTAQAGDWIIRGVHGEFYPCKPDIFAATYEEVHDDATA